MWCFYFTGFIPFQLTNFIHFKNMANFSFNKLFFLRYMRITVLSSNLEEAQKFNMIFETTKLASKKTVQCSRLYDSTAQQQSISYVYRENLIKLGNSKYYTFLFPLVILFPSYAPPASQSLD